MRGSNQENLVHAVIAAGVRDQRVLQALREVPRVAFVPPSLAEQAYLDEPLPIPHGQVTTQPSLVARMIASLRLTGSEVVLEIGTGYGFQTALLAHLARFVWSVERWPDLADTARANLAREEITNVMVITGDGSEGLSAHAPFDAILVSAAFPEVPTPLKEQLAPGGRLVQPVGLGGDDVVTLFERSPQGLEPRGIVTGARFVRLYGKHGYSAEWSGGPPYMRKQS